MSTPTALRPLRTRMTNRNTIYRRMSLIAFRVTRSEAPTSATTASHKLVYPPTVSATNATLVTSAKAMFCTDDRLRRPRQTHRRRNPGQVVAHQRDIGSIDRRC